MNFELPCVHVAPKKGPPFLDTRARKAIKPYLVLDGGIDCEKTGGPTKQVERRGRAKSGPIDPYAPFEHEHDDEHDVSAGALAKVEHD